MVFLLLRKRGKLRKKEEQTYLNSWINKALNIEEPNDFHSRIFLHSIFGHYYKFIKSNDKSFYHYNEIMEIWDSRPHFIENQKTRYLIGYSNFLSSLCNIGEFKLLKKSLEKLNHVQTSTHDDSCEKFWMLSMYWVMYALNTSDYEKGWEVVSLIENQGDNYKSKLIKSTELILFSNIRYLYFHTQEYKKALEWNNKILSDPKVEIAENIRRASLILQLPIHYSLDNHEIIDSILTSVRRSLIRNKDLDEIESRTLRLFHELQSNQNKNNILNDFLSYYEIKKETLIPAVFYSLSEWVRSTLYNQGI